MVVTFEKQVTRLLHTIVRLTAVCHAAGGLLLDI